MSENFACPKVVLSETIKKQSESFLSEIFCPKVLSPKVFGFNVQEICSMPSPVRHGRTTICNLFYSVAVLGIAGPGVEVIHGALV